MARHRLCCDHDDNHDWSGADPALLCILATLDSLGDLIVTTAQTTADAVTTELTTVLTDLVAEHDAEVAALKAAQASGQPVDFSGLQAIADKLRAAVPGQTPAETPKPVVTDPAPTPTPGDGTAPVQTAPAEPTTTPVDAPAPVTSPAVSPI